MARLPDFQRTLAAVLAVLVIAAAGLLTSQRGGEAPWWTVGVGEGGEAAIKRSPADARHYRYLRLANGLQVLLVSDPATDKSAAALDVRTGSFQNPTSRAGLAHFLEHMLFLGTEKYPQAGEYQAFISEHGGSHNAFTSLENTTYYFEIDARHLDAALDRFAQFFISPRFDQALIDREREAVDSEYRLKIRDDGRREWDVLSEVVNPAHPLAQFSVGDRATLADRADDPVRDDLIAFYRAHYSADRMALVVLGRESLAQLEALARDRFAAVPKRVSEPPTAPVPLLTTPLPSAVVIKPDQEKRTLNLLFPVPSERAHWRTKPAEFLGYLVGDESAGSLLAKLKSAGLAEALSAGLGFDGDSGAAFNISIALTPAGLARKEEILEWTFAWLAKLRGEALVEWRYREFSRLQQIGFRFSEKQPPATYVQALSAALQRYPPAEALRGPVVLDRFDAALIGRYANLLVPGNALISVVDPTATGFDRTSKHYGAPYRVARVPEPQVQRWRDARQTDRFALAAPNRYLPEAFPMSGRGGNARPRLERHDQRATLWYYADDRFATPRAIYVARLAVPAVAGPARALAMTELYLALVRDQLNAQIYPAALAGLDVDLSVWRNGIAITLQGYADKQPVLLETVLQALADPNLDPDRVGRIKAMLIREWRNSVREWPIKQVFEELGPVLGGGYRQVELADALESVTDAELGRFVDGFYRTGHGWFYAGGAQSAATAQAMTDAVSERLGLGRNGDSEILERVLRLSPTALRPQRCIAVESSDSSSVLYLQGASDDIEERAEVAMLANVLEAAFYNELRTQRQLGYVVGSGVLPIHRVPGMILYVQSPKVDADALMREISGFLVDFGRDLRTLDEAGFERHRQAVLTGVEEIPQNLAELAARHQESLLLGYTETDFRERLARAIRGLSREQLLAAYRRVVVLGSRGLWVTTLDRSNGAQCVDRETLINRSNGYYLYPQ